MATVAILFRCFTNFAWKKIAINNASRVGKWRRKLTKPDFLFKQSCGRWFDQIWVNTNFGKRIDAISEKV